MTNESTPQTQIKEEALSRAPATQSSSIKELATALVKAQSQLKGAKKDSENPFFKSKYADLHSVWEAARDPLTKNGLCVIQTTEVQGSDLGVKTILIHTSGEWVSSFLPLTEKPQVTGTAISYSRRYGLSAMIGIYSEDDDAEKATVRPSKLKTLDQGEEPPPFEPDLSWTNKNR